MKKKSKEIEVYCITTLSPGGSEKREGGGEKSGGTCFSFERFIPKIKGGSKEGTLAGLRGRVELRERSRV